MNTKSVIAGIVTYNPDIKRLTENMNAVLEQVEKVVIIDNNSNNIKEIISMISQYGHETVVLLKNLENKGIAYALSQIMEYAKINSYSWVLTLDQDSVIKYGLIDEYWKYVQLPKNNDVGMFTCLIKDRNFSDNQYEHQDNNIIDVNYCITAGALTSVQKYYLTKGYDSKFFIDCVDFDFCYTLRENGYRICRINYLGLIHEVGRGENRFFLWKKIVVYHHDAKRVFTLTRNTIWLWRKHGEEFPLHIMIKKLLAIFARIILFEREKKKKIKAFFHGLRKGYSPI